MRCSIEYRETYALHTQVVEYIMFYSRRIFSNDLAFRSIVSNRRLHTRIGLLSKEYVQPKNELKIKTGKPPRSLQDSARYLRRTSVPNFRYANLTGKNAVEEILVNRFKVMPCTTVTTGEKYDLEKCIKLLTLKGLQPVSLIPDEVIMFKYQCDGYRGDVMILAQNASVTCWGFDEAFVNENILKLVESARVNPLPKNLFESEDMDYVEICNENEFQRIQADLSKLPSGSNNIFDISESSSLVGDLIVVNSYDKDAGLLDKVAFSSGLARSTKLAVLEGSMEDHVSKTRIITEKISRGVKLNLNESDALKSIGRLFLIRGNLNLYSELIETPDLYWSEPRLEKIFKETSKYLDIAPRISILNTKLDYLTDECRAIMGVLNERKGTFLEWIIIYLITLEICFEIYHFYERYWLDRKVRAHV